jgi:hypothetical protein
LILVQGGVLVGLPTAAPSACAAGLIAAERAPPNLQKKPNRDRQVICVAYGCGHDLSARQACRGRCI